MLTLFWFNAGLLVVWAHVGFTLAMWRRRNDIADVMWALGFVLVAWASIWLVGFMTPRAFMVAALVTTWGARLAFHIHRRNHGRPEDPRYRKWREEWGGMFVVRSYFQVFLLQSLLLGLVALPAIWVADTPISPWSLLDLAGLALWWVGFFFEVVGDEQLRRFCETKKPGAVMRTGLWQYSRHPNYFGEVAMAWGLWVIVCAAPGGWITVVGPLTLTVLILRVSGIPMLEARYAGNKEFQDYKRRTSAFFPMPPRRA